MSTSCIPSFIKIHQAVLEKKSKMWKFTTTDGRTDDGRCAMTIAHLSLWLRWAKKDRLTDTLLSCKSYCFWESARDNLSCEFLRSEIKATMDKWGNNTKNTIESKPLSFFLSKLAHLLPMMKEPLWYLKGQRSKVKVTMDNYNRVLEEYNLPVVALIVKYSGARYVALWAPLFIFLVARLFTSYLGSEPGSHHLI